MPRKARYKNLLEKSINAAVSAIEIYNKPDFKYREESFCILMVNAWELLLKTKILKDNSNKLNSLYIALPNQEHKQRLIYKKNRAGNFLTIDIKGAIGKVDIDSVLKENIMLLVEIRDNAIHFFNESKLLEKKVLEIGTATLKSYVNVVNDWFNFSLSNYNFYLMPISFFHPHEMESFSINNEDKQHQNLLKFIAKKEAANPSEVDKNHNISLVLETKFVKSKSVDAISVKYDPNAKLKVKIDTEEKFAGKYPWDYKTLLSKLTERYSDYKLNNSFYKIKKGTEKQEQFCGIRYLDFKNRRGAKMKYYSTEILKEFDKHYTKK